MKHGARNDIPAGMIEIETGGVMTQVKVKLVGTDYEMSTKNPFRLKLYLFSGFDRRDA